MNRLWNSAAFRLSLICGGLVMISVIVLSVAIYFGTVGVLERSAHDKILNIAERIAASFKSGGITQVAEKIELALVDGVDSDTEIYLVVDGHGNKLVGNIALLDQFSPTDTVVERPVVREGRAAFGVLVIHAFPDQSLLVVGRDMSDLNEIKSLIWRAIGIGGLLALILSIFGTIFFQSQIERIILSIRHAALEIATGNLSRRIPISTENDEFARLSHDLNRMLDKIENLMEGVRHVSNSIAHNLRTPLGRIRSHLDEALRGSPGVTQLVSSGNYAIEEIDGLIVLLEKLLQIAEAESETRRVSFRSVELRDLFTNIVELYDAVAEEMQVSLHSEISGDPVIFGDPELLASALSNLLDNALKYAGSSAIVVIRALQTKNSIILQVQDNGPGIPESEYKNVLRQFYRLDHALPGNGIGLSFVEAIVHLHGGTLMLKNGAPGLLVQMEFPLPELPT